MGPLIEPACQLAYFYLKDWQEAEDAVQEACLKAWRAAGRLREDTVSLRPWFFTIVANEARSRRRSRWWSVLRLADPSERGHVPGHEDEVVRHADIDAALADLPEEQRQILLLHFYLDLPLADVAQVMGMSHEATKSRLYRAARKLRPAVAIQEVGS